MLQTTISFRPFLTTDKGEVTKLYRITNNNGAYVEISDLGASIVSLYVPDKTGKLTDVVLSYSTYKGFSEGEEYFGASVGRVAGRIAKGTFTLEGKKYKVATNNGVNHLHGGVNSFSRRIWSSSIEKGKLIMKLTSSDGDEGYPGELTVKIVFTFDDSNTLKIEYYATTNKTTLCNLTNHTYFNLNGEGNPSILDNYLYINADRYLPVDATLIPLGETHSVKDTPFDFRKFKQIGRDIAIPSVQLSRAIGYDHDFIIKDYNRECAVAYSPLTGIKLTCNTTCPVIHLYSGNYVNLKPSETKSHRPYPYRCGFALETQGYNDAINHPDYPQYILHPGETYHTCTTYKFSLI
ncbi:MAG: galactose mutarotase [Coprobacillus sp.]|nr:galactose mutarotase [Coprobacillus sp.]